MARARKKRFGNTTLLDHKRYIKNAKEHMKFKRVTTDERLNWETEIKRHQREIEHLNNAYPDLVEERFTKQELVNVINHHLKEIETRIENDLPVVILKFDYGRELRIVCSVRQVRTEFLPCLDMKGD